MGGIWIRSQNKNCLVCTSHIGYTDTAFLLRTGHFIVGYDDEQCTILGEYATKERSLQVLDEIQDFIVCDGELNRKVRVFEMPAE